MSVQISKDMTFGELVNKFPECGSVLAGYGLHCIGCHIGLVETIEEGARAHGLSDQQIDQMLEDLNALVGV